MEHKGLHDMVSYVDQETEKQLVAGLRELLPEAGFITEEGTAAKARTEEYNWIIDPLDGTTNFMHGLPVYSVSVALMHRDELVVGVVYEVISDECFRAALGGGAFCNEQPIHVSAAANLNKSLIATGFPYNKFDQMDAYLKMLGAFMQSTHGVRRLGSAAVDLAYVAAGRFEAILSSTSTPTTWRPAYCWCARPVATSRSFSRWRPAIWPRSGGHATARYTGEMQQTIGEYWK